MVEQAGGAEWPTPDPQSQWKQPPGTPSRFRLTPWHSLPIPADLFILFDGLLLGLGDDGLQLMELALHLLQFAAGLLLFTPDLLQQLFAVFLSDAGTLLPLLDPLGQDLIDTAAEWQQSKTLTG